MSLIGTAPQVRALAATTATHKLPLPKGERVHRLTVLATTLTVVALLGFLVVKGAGYYILALEERPLSPLHEQLRSSGTVGLKLGIVSLVMFGVLFLYPLRKRVKWLSRIGATRRWLRLHVLFGVTTPLVVTFHTAFRWHGLAGLAYWTMIAVAISGFVGRYLYSKIPRSLNSAKLSVEELEAKTAGLAARLHDQEVFRPEDLAPLLNLPAAQEVRRMSLVRVLWMMLRRDLARPFLVSRLRRRALSGSQYVSTLGGFLPSHDRDVENIVYNLRRQSRLTTAMAFLDRTERIFHLWHIIHRPFSISFVILIVVHIGVALSVGLR
jgi:hypothetical protein